jgi:hypothetical protein
VTGCEGTGDDDDLGLFESEVFFAIAAFDLDCSIQVRDDNEAVDVGLIEVLERAIKVKLTRKAASREIELS